MKAQTCIGVSQVTLLESFGNLTTEVEYTTVVMSTNSGGDCCRQVGMGCPPQIKLQTCSQRQG